VNIVLDLVFVAGFHMDVTGAALATMIAMMTSWICSVVYIRKKYPELQFPLLPCRIEKSIVKDVISVGLPLGMNSSIYSVGHLLVQAVVIQQI
jgi:Na+-driven multidrug efflux pump